MLKENTENNGKKYFSLLFKYLNQIQRADIIYGDTKINDLNIKISLFKELLKEINSEKGEMNSILK